MKIIKIAIITCLVSITMFGVQNRNVYAATPTPRDHQVQEGGGGTSPYPNYNWIYVNTIKTSSLQIANVNALSNAIVGFVLGFVPYVGTVYAALGVTAAVTQLIKDGKEQYYVKLIQYISSDYKHMYFQVNMYSDENYKNFIGYYYTAMQNTNL